VFEVSQLRLALLLAFRHHHLSPFHTQLTSCSLPAGAAGVRGQPAALWAAAGGAGPVGRAAGAVPAAYRRCLPAVDIRNAAAAEWLSGQLPFARDRDAIGNTYEAWARVCSPSQDW